MKRKLIFIFIFLAFFTIAHAETPVSEEALEAAYIYHFINFTEWNDHLSNYYVCIPDNEPLKNALQDSFRGKTVNDRNIVVLHHSQFCHILIADQTPPSQTSLTIGYLNKGAILEFRRVNNKLKFAVDLEKLKRSKLKISSQLLKLAIVEKS